MPAKTRSIGLILFVALLALPAFAAAAEFSIQSANYQPAPTSPGQLVTLYITIKSNNNANSGPITVTVKPEYPFLSSTSGKSEKKFDTILARQSVLAVLEIQVDNAALNGTYPLKIQIKNKDGLALLEQNLNITVNAVKPQLEIVSLSQNTGQPGELLQTTLTIKNVGSSTANNIFVGTANERTVTATGVVVDFPIKNTGTSLVFVETLSPNQTVEIPLQLGIDSTADQKTYVVPIQINYQDTNRSDYDTTRNIGIRVEGQSEVDASTTPDAKLKLYPGAIGQASVNLFNRGNAIARNIVVTVTDNPILTLQSEKTIFIGTLDPDDFDSFNLSAKVKSDTKPGAYPLVLTLEYKNQNYETKTEQHTIDLQIFSSEDANPGSGGIPWGTVITALVVLGILYWGYNRFVKKPNGKK